MATSGQFQALKVPADQLDGTLKVDVIDPGALPVTVVRGGDDWKIVVSWEITGELVDWLTGKWNVQVVADRLGGGESTHPAAPVVVPFTPGAGAYATTIAMRNQLAAGTYDLVVNLTSTTAAGTAGNLGGFVALNKIMVQ
ncbi:hypothetical protein [Sphaerisporangium perillae]|uniref:hypothetical protein n=1 Tax=Sphaerisporangium perillae TaxID=2935860 RepID=UPI00200EAEDC|nr:hypothetical protein [Sphaerisporangium perillae]